MSNYPPGVTGNEPQIAGLLRETTLSRQCGKSGTVYLIEKSWADNFSSKRAILGGTWWPEIVEMQVDECPFDGEVDVQLHQGGVETWECPLCGHEHEDELDDDRDY